MRTDSAEASWVKEAEESRRRVLHVASMESLSVLERGPGEAECGVELLGLRALLREVLPGRWTGWAVER